MRGENRKTKTRRRASVCSTATVCVAQLMTWHESLPRDTSSRSLSARPSRKQQRVLPFVLSRTSESQPDVTHLSSTEAPTASSQTESCRLASNMVKMNKWIQWRNIKCKINTLKYMFTRIRSRNTGNYIYLVYILGWIITRFHNKQFCRPSSLPLTSSKLFFLITLKFMRLFYTQCNL